MRVRTLASTLLMTAALSGLPPLSAQQQQPRGAPPATQPTQQPAYVERSDAPTVREQLRDVLQEYPPSLAQVLRLDPTLLASPPYLQPYPRLAAFIAQHPEIGRSPGYFLGNATTGYPDSRRQTVDAIQETLAGLAFFLFFMAALTVATHIGRSILEHRRWMHATKIQTEAHTKLVDRLASNEELMAYVQSPAGQRFLTSAPMAIEPDLRAANYAVPYGRILTAAQIGVVAACGGLGLWIAKDRVIEEVAQLLHVISILGIALGLGFVLSALMSYGLSRQLGLLKPASHA
jgi:hypothetical protein